METVDVGQLSIDLRAVLLALRRAQGELRAQSSRIELRSDELRRAEELASRVLAALDAERKRSPVR